MQEARDRSVHMPSDWSVNGLLDKLTEAMMDVQAAVLKTAAGLRRSGTQNTLKRSKLTEEFEQEELKESRFKPRLHWLPLHKEISRKNGKKIQI